MYFNIQYSFPIFRVVSAHKGIGKLQVGNLPRIHVKQGA